jgi:hypothetical protein
LVFYTSDLDATFDLSKKSLNRFPKLLKINFLGIPSSYAGSVLFNNTLGILDNGHNVEVFQATLIEH